MSTATLSPATNNREVALDYETLGNSPKGCQCVFVRIGDRGLKTYRSERERDRHKYHQLRLANLGVAPYVDESVDVVLPDGSRRWGYWSGLAEVATDRHGRQFSTHPDDPGYDDLQDLSKRLRDRAGYEFIDNHNGNWGYINGRAVLIDTPGH